jgi:hypothetical protein
VPQPARSAASPAIIARAPLENAIRYLPRDLRGAHALAA